jgi:hypothetical protein
MLHPYVNPKTAGPKGDSPHNAAVLVVEYDMPLTNTVGAPKTTESIRKGLHEFYLSVKMNYEYYRYIFITGVTKFDQLSVLSGTNTLKDITLVSDYSTIC